MCNCSGCKPGQLRRDLFPEEAWEAENAMGLRLVMKQLIETCGLSLECQPSYFVFGTALALAARFELLYRRLFTVFFTAIFCMLL